MSDDTLLDDTLDDLADLPTSSPFVTGSHRCQMFITRNEKKASNYIVKFKHIAVLELANATDEPPKSGDEALMFLHTKKKDGTANEIGQGQLKMLIEPLAERLGTRSITEILAAIKKEGVEVAITSGVKKQDGEYADQMVLKKFELV